MSLLNFRVASDLLVGWAGEGAAAGLAVVTSIQTHREGVAFLTHLTEIPCAVVPTVLIGWIDKASGALLIYSKTSLTDTYNADTCDVLAGVSIAFAVTRQTFSLFAKERSFLTNLQRKQGFRIFRHADPRALCACAHKLSGTSVTILLWPLKQSEKRMFSLITSLVK